MQNSAFFDINFNGINSDTYRAIHLRKTRSDKKGKNTNFMNGCTA